MIDRPIVLPVVRSDNRIEKLSLPSVGTATANADDTVLGVQGGALKRFPVSEVSGVTPAFTQTGAGATSRSLLSKLLDLPITPQDFGAVGNGVADDTAAVHAAFNAAKAGGGRAFFPVGKYRITSGYLHSTNYKDLHITGVGASRENSGDQGSVIILDSSDPAVFFYHVAARQHLQVSNITFRCAKYALDRPFFKFSSTGTNHLFLNVNFESVERPIVYAAGCYFQSSALRDVQFRSSGTLHSEAGALAGDLFGTLLVLDNCNHEGLVPTNTEKVVCNLRGIRQIQGRNVLLEGALPSAGWTVLKLRNGYDSDWTNSTTATFNGFHSEWAGTYAPSYTVDQARGRVRFNGAGEFVGPARKYKLSEKARVEISGYSFAGSSYDPADAFEQESALCTVVLENCSTRSINGLSNKAITYRNCHVANSDTKIGQVSVSNDLASVVYRYDGGHIDGEEATLTLSGGTTSYPSTDTDHGRKVVIVPNGNAINGRITLKLRGQIEEGDVYTVAVRARLPVFTGGSLQLQAMLNSATNIASTFGPEYSGQVVQAVIPARVHTTPISNIGFGFGAVSMSGVSGVLDILALRIYHGRGAIPASMYESRKKNILTWNSSAPTAGTWERGDIIYNNAPAAGGTVGWICTTAGTPGTWNPFGAISA